MKEERKDPSYKKAFFILGFIFIGAFLVAQMEKNLPAMQETCVWSLGQEHALEKEMATHSSRNLVATVHSVTKSWIQLID